MGDSHVGSIRFVASFVMSETPEPCDRLQDIVGLGRAGGRGVAEWLRWLDSGKDGKRAGFGANGWQG